MKLAQLFEDSGLASWFGNSKVVDATGKPLKVYRGVDTSTGHDGYHFTDDKALASDFAKTGRGAGYEGGAVLIAYLKIEKPYYFKTGGSKIGLEQKLKAEGYDGFIAEYKNAREFVVFEQSQIRPVHQA